MGLRPPGTPPGRARLPRGGRLWLTCLVLALASCAPQGPRFVQHPVEFAAYRPFLSLAPLLPFRAAGSVRLRYGGETESGEFVLVAAHPVTFQFRLMARFTGSLVLEVRFDERRMLVLDYARSTYFLGPNSAENRKRLFALDITPREFLIALTGRVPEAEFAEAGGEWISPRQARMGGEAAHYRFWLDAHGLPSRWVKLRDGQELYRVEYRDYLSLSAAAGPPLRLPRKLRIYSGGEAPLLVLGVREFLPGMADREPLDFDPPSGGGWRFEPLPAPVN